MAYAPQRGEAVWLSFKRRIGDEQTVKYPALILTPTRYNRKVGFAICCPITQRSKGYPFEVKIPDGLNVTGVVLSDQVKHLDWRSRQAELICLLPEATVIQVLRKLNTLLGD